MARIMKVQIEILKGLGVDKRLLPVLIRTRGNYLRQLAYSVINNNFDVKTASKLFLYY